ncbi:hypothetical protein CPB86DRAFT_721794 [Serendipita vermifera]|nr:hypothetical protein CPB86DRAFT_721794 [Serendipita vermifera]
MTPLPRDAEDDNQNEIPISEISEIFGAGTPLDRTIDRIGMGGYQYTLLALCGLGWAADNVCPVPFMKSQEGTPIDLIVSLLLV